MCTMRRVAIQLEVCVPELGTKQDETGDHSRMAGTGTGLLLYGPVGRENSGKIREKFGTGRDYSVLLGKSLEWY